MVANGGGWIVNLSSIAGTKDAATNDDEREIKAAAEPG
jgi:NADP-dependent 3-hydroxy acid dehydrogenase YdfG